MKMAHPQSNGAAIGLTAANAQRTPRQLHRIRTVRRQQGVTLRTVARRLKITVAQVRTLEDETTDIPVSVLYQLQDVLRVPLAELLLEQDGTPSSAPVQFRAQLVRLMKSARALLENVKSARLQRMAETIVEQLITIMPELKDVTSWHTVGPRRSLEDMGRIAEHPLPDIPWQEPAIK